jgi:hypothetical protein
MARRCLSRCVILSSKEHDIDALLKQLKQETNSLKLIDVSGLTHGIYIIKLLGNDKQVLSTSKLLKN